MEPIQAALLVGVLLAAAYIFGDWHQRREDRVRVRRRVLVNLDTGQSFAGVLWCKTGDWLVLRNAELIERGQAPTPLDGETVLERRRVEFVQVL